MSRHYLYRKRFIIWMDHVALPSLMNFEVYGSESKYLGDIRSRKVNLATGGDTMDAWEIAPL